MIGAQASCLRVKREEVFGSVWKLGSENLNSATTHSRRL